MAWSSQQALVAQARLALHAIDDLFDGCARILHMAHAVIDGGHAGVDPPHPLAAAAELAAAMAARLHWPPRQPSAPLRPRGPPPRQWRRQDIGLEAIESIRSDDVADLAGSIAELLHIYIYIYIYIYVHMHVHTRTCICIYTPHQTISAVGHA